MICGPELQCWKVGRSWRELEMRKPALGGLFDTYRLVLRTLCGEPSLAADSH